MLTSESRIQTNSASRYLQQLCKHWSHKFAVEFTPEHGIIPLPDERRCELTATDHMLTLRVSAPNAESLQRTKSVVIDHLKRFAFREDLGEVQWKDLAEAD